MWRRGFPGSEFFRTQLGRAPSMYNVVGERYEAASQDARFRGKGTSCSQGKQTVLKHHVGLNIMSTRRSCGFAHSVDLHIVSTRAVAEGGASFRGRQDRQSTERGQDDDDAVATDFLPSGND